ncbi:hypothetical protein M2298_003763 [Brevibacillus sp. 1238]|nr:hypothetical protein [Brevibacillus sp. 1238]
MPTSYPNCLFYDCVRYSSNYTLNFFEFRNENSMRIILRNRMLFYLFISIFYSHTEPVKKKSARHFADFFLFLSFCNNLVPRMDKHGKKSGGIC